MLQPEPFTIDISNKVLADLRSRISGTRWPADLDDGSWRLGADRSYLQGLLAYWREAFDWRAQERRLNAYPQFRIELDDAPQHFVHLRGVKPAVTSPAPIPILLGHGWPNTFADLLDLADRLADPGRFGGDADSQAFDVVIPSLPGYVFSGLPPRPWTWAETPRLWVELMALLGYERFVAHGTDIGGQVIRWMAVEYPESLLGIHTVSATVGDPGPDPLSKPERAMVAENERWEKEDAAYTFMQETRPMTAAYGLTDSPAGLAAWIVEKLREWSDLELDGDFERVWSKDRSCTLLTLYWATSSIGTSFVSYFDPMQAVAPRPWHPTDVPAAFALFPRNITPVPREWAERGYTNIVRWTEMPRGGHFPSVEAVDDLAADIRAVDWTSYTSRR
jgi:pimeloyl-ACP methyl ester carboxylesterase